MFIRQKNNKSGTVSIQIIDRSRGRYKVVKTFGCSMDPLELDRLLTHANAEMLRLSQPLNFNFDPGTGHALASLAFPDAAQIRLAGPELVFGKLYDVVGFGSIKDELFRHLVLSRICYPLSKLKTIDYLSHSKGVSLDAERINLYLERLGDRQKDRIVELCGAHAKSRRKKAFREIICFVAPLHYESVESEGIKMEGVGREPKTNHPPLLFVLFVNTAGDPLAYELVEANRMNYRTLQSIAAVFAAKHRTKQLLVVTDTSLFPEEAPSALKELAFDYLMGTRLKSDDPVLLKQLRSLKLKDGKIGEIMLDAETRLVVGFSAERAAREKFNRQKGLEKLERAIQMERLSRKNINNRGYNRYLKPTGKTGVAIDYRKFRRDEKLNGLRAILTNTKLQREQLYEPFDQLSTVGNAFRISLADLISGSQDHLAMTRIDSHFSIAFAAFKIVRELEKLLATSGMQLNAGDSIQTAKTILEITVQDPVTGLKSAHLHLQNQSQRELLGLFGS